MSKDRTTAPATMPRRTDGDGNSLRFTPLRSYVNRARALTQEAKSELHRSRLVPIARLQS